MLRLDDTVNPFTVSRIEEATQRLIGEFVDEKWGHLLGEFADLFLAIQTALEHILPTVLSQIVFSYAKPDVHKTITGHQEFFNAYVEPFLAMLSERNELLKPQYIRYSPVLNELTVAQRVRKIFEFEAQVIEAAVVCRQPTSTELHARWSEAAQMEPEIRKTFRYFADGSDMDENQPVGGFISSLYIGNETWHQKALREVAEALSWLQSDNPPVVVQAARESTEYYMNRILVAARDKPPEERKKDQEFVTKTKTFLSGYLAYVKEYFPKQINWKEGGILIRHFLPIHKPTSVDSRLQRTTLERLEIVAKKLEAYCPE